MCIALFLLFGLVGVHLGEDGHTAQDAEQSHDQHTAPGPGQPRLFVGELEPPGQRHVDGDEEHQQPGCCNAGQPEQDHLAHLPKGDDHRDRHAARKDQQLHGKPGAQRCQRDAQQDGRGQQEQGLVQHQPGHLQLGNANAAQDGKAVDVGGELHGVNAQHRDQGHCRNDVQVKAVIHPLLYVGGVGSAVHTGHPLAHRAAGLLQVCRDPERGIELVLLALHAHKILEHGGQLGLACPLSRLGQQGVRGFVGHGHAHQQLVGGVLRQDPQGAVPVDDAAEGVGLFHGDAALAAGHPHCKGDLLPKGLVQPHGAEDWPLNGDLVGGFGPAAVVQRNAAHIQHPVVQGAKGGKPRRGGHLTAVAGRAKGVDPFLLLRLAQPLAVFRGARHQAAVPAAIDLVAEIPVGGVDAADQCQRDDGKGKREQQHQKDQQTAALFAQRSLPCQREKLTIHSGHLDFWYFMVYFSVAKPGHGNQSTESTSFWGKVWQRKFAFFCNAAHPAAGGFGAGKRPGKNF